VYKLRIKIELIVDFFSFVGVKWKDPAYPNPNQHTEVQLGEFALGGKIKTPP
jgi:hypothetical protein